jgi:type I restriction enzyme M protein
MAELGFLNTLRAFTNRLPIVLRWNELSPDGPGGKKLHPEVLSLLGSYLDAVDLSNRNESVNVLGDAYKYLIKRFAYENKGGTIAGQFLTP